MNKSEAIKATRNGAIAASISAAFTLVVVLIAINTDAAGKLAIFNDPTNFIDIVLVLGCAIGMYRKSRIASILIVVYFIVSKVIIAVETHAYGGFGVALVFLYFYGKAIQGSFVYHKLEKAENPDYKPVSKWAYIIGIPSVLFIVVALGFALLSTVGVVPSTRVQAGSEMNAGEIATLRENRIISPADNVEYFYAQGLSSILESGNVLTQNSVILYYTDENEELQVYEIPLDEVTEVVLETQGDSLNDSVYRVNTSDPERWIKLFLSVEQKGDQKFVRALHARLARSMR